MDEKQPILDPNLSWRLLDGEAVIVSPVSGEIRVLNAVGTEIWQRLADGASIAQIESSLVEQYQLSAQQAEADVTAFLHDLTERHLIVWECI